MWDLNGHNTETYAVLLSYPKSAKLPRKPSNPEVQLNIIKVKNKEKQRY